MKYPLAAYSVAPIIIFGLCACGQQDSDEQLQTWIAQAGDIARNAVTTPVAMPPTNNFQPRPYLIDSDATPFGANHQATPVSALMSTPPDERPSQRGPRQPLEGFALDTLQLVGTLLQGRHYSALIQAGGVLYRVRLGDYLGPRFGRVERISDSALELQELQHEADGSWTAKTVLLTFEGGLR